MKKRYRNILLIAGTGRKAGKTKLACELIEHFSVNEKIFAVKISPHEHGQSKDSAEIVKTDNFALYEETDMQLQKDSGRMLRAGASASFYIESQDDFLVEAFQQLLSLIPESAPVICESPVLRHYINPAIFIITDNRDVRFKKAEVLAWREKADFIYDMYHNTVKDVYSKISFSSGSWHLL